MGQEFYYTDENGEKQDAGLHEEILNSSGANEAVEVNRHRSYREGMSIELIERNFGPFINRPD